MDVAPSSANLSPMRFLALMRERGPRARPVSARPISRTTAATTLALLMVAALIAPASADPKAEEFKRDIEQLDQEQAQVRAEADRLEEEQRKVRAEQERINADLQAATDRLAELEAELAALIDQAAETAREVANLSDRKLRQRQQLGDRARALYQLGGVDPMLMMLSGKSTDEIVDTAHYVAALSNKDQTTIEAFSATNTRLDRRQHDLGEDRREVADVQADVQAAREELEARMKEAVATEDRLVELEKQAQANLAKLEKREQTRRAEEKARLAEIERKRREEAARRAAERRAAERRAAQKAAARAAAQQRSAPARRASRSSSGGSSGSAPSSGGKACPQAQPRSFTNDWGNPRSGGRTHKGTDIFGRMGGKVYAITSGTIQFTKTGRSAGLFLGLRGDDGHSYWYMHLSGFAARPGQRVSAGQVIAYNGDTGNAKGTTPHIHFEYHPGGGGATNPYPLLSAIC